MSKILDLSHPFIGPLIPVGQFATPHSESGGRVQVCCYQDDIYHDYFLCANKDGGWVWRKGLHWAYTFSGVPSALHALEQVGAPGKCVGIWHPATFGRIP